MKKKTSHYRDFGITPRFWDGILIFKTTWGKPRFFEVEFLNDEEECFFEVDKTSGFCFKAILFNNMIG
jgi:hypothetical protein